MSLGGVCENANNVAKSLSHSRTGRFFAKKSVQQSTTMRCGAHRIKRISKELNVYVLGVVKSTTIFLNQNGQAEVPHANIARTATDR